MNIRILIVAAILLPFVPAVSADGACPPGNDAVTSITNPVDGTLLYVSGEPGVYQESNNLAGLQSSAGTCVDGDGREVSYPGDAKLA